MGCGRGSHCAAPDAAPDTHRDHSRTLQDTQGHSRTLRPLKDTQDTQYRVTGGKGYPVLSLGDLVAPMLGMWSGFSVGGPGCGPGHSRTLKDTQGHSTTLKDTQDTQGHSGHSGHSRIIAWCTLGPPRETYRVTGGKGYPVLSLGDLVAPMLGMWSGFSLCGPGCGQGHSRTLKDTQGHSMTGPLKFLECP